MAFDNLKHALGAENLGSARASNNLTGGQYLAVTLTQSGVDFIQNVNSGIVCVLYNNPASGGACTVYGPGHTVKGKAMGTILQGVPITITGSSGFQAQQTSGDAQSRIGYAITSAVSGDIFSLRLL